MCGVYMVECTANGMRYIGGTKMSFAQRFDAHRFMLRSGEGPRLLQAAYDLYGPEALRFTVMETLTADEVHAREKELIASLEPELNMQGNIARSSFRLTHNKTATTFQHKGKETTFPLLAKECGLSAGVLRARYLKGLRDDQLVAPKHKARRTPSAQRDWEAERALLAQQAEIRRRNREMYIQSRKEARARRERELAERYV